MNMIDALISEIQEKDKKPHHLHETLSDPRSLTRVFSILGNTVGYKLSRKT